MGVPVPMQHTDAIFNDDDSYNTDILIFPYKYAS
jgi:hypothetical protein